MCELIAAFRIKARAIVETHIDPKLHASGRRSLGSMRSSTGFSNLILWDLTRKLAPHSRNIWRPNRVQMSIASGGYKSYIHHYWLVSIYHLV